MERKFEVSKDEDSRLYGVIRDGGIVYDSEFSLLEAERIASCLNTNENFTWDDIADYVNGHTNVKPKAKKRK